jgi:monovalent cation/proton antiporter MnhG/PhaG subunit
MSVFEWIRFLAGAALTLGGMFFLVSAVVGNYRFSYALFRMHASGLGDTMGLLLLFTGLAVLCGSFAFISKLALIIILIWTGSPVATHLILRMEIKEGSSADGKKETMKK